MQLNTNPSLDLSWVDNLKDLDNHAALQKATQHLARYIEDESLSGSDRYRTTLIIDQKIRDKINMLTHNFVSNQHLRATLAAKMYEAAYFYHRQLYRCYRELIKGYLEKPDNLTFNFAQLPLVIGRTMSASYAMMKWRYYSLESTTENAWLEIFELYKIAERESLLDSIVRLYPDEPEINLSAAFIQACMLGSLDQSTLSKKHIEIISKLLHRWMNSSVISSVYDEKKHLYVVDLEKGQPAKRIRHFEPTPGCRYWDIDQFSLRISSTMKALENNQTVEDLGISDLGSAAELLPILTLMHSEWSRTEYKRQRRTSERKKTAKLVIAIYGIDEISKRIRTNNGIYANLSETEMLEKHQSISRSVKTAPKVLNRYIDGDSWVINNESAAGYGILARNELDPQVKLGKLVGLTFKEKPNKLILGSIRSIKKLASGRHQIGIKILAREAFWMQLSHVNLKTQKQELIDDFSENLIKISDQFQAFSGIYLPEEESLSEKPSLLLPRLEFRKNSTYQLIVFGKKTTVQLASIREEKDDWVRVACPYLAPPNYSSTLLQPPPSALNKSTVATNLA